MYQILSRVQKTETQSKEMFILSMNSDVVFLLCHQALESKLAACRNFAKDQAVRKTYSKDNGTVINGSANKFSHSLHTTYFDKT